MKKSEYLRSGDYSLVSGTDFDNGFINWDSCSFVTEWRYNQDVNIQLRNGDVLITKDGTIGKVAYVQDMPSPTTLNSGVFVIRPKDKALHPSFLQLIFKSRFFTDFLDKITAGSTIVHLYQKDIVDFEFPIPEISEQLRIAQSIANIDEALIVINRLISKYESIKKATIKKLMTPEEGWKLISFGELCDDYGYGVSAAAKEYDGVNKYIRITDIDDTSHKFLPSPLASPSFFSEKHIVHDGDILFARTGASVGKSYLYNPNDGRLIYAGFLIRMHIDPSKANPAFIFQQTLTNVYWQWVATESARTGQPGLNIEQYKKWKVLIPSIEVQNAIVYKLSAYDNKISELNKTLNKLIKVKLSMLQYFFGD